MRVVEECDLARRLVAFLHVRWIQTLHFKLVGLELALGT